jgi:hypothetical protein
MKRKRKCPACDSDLVIHKENGRWKFIHNGKPYWSWDCENFFCEIDEITYSEDGVLVEWTRIKEMTKKGRGTVEHPVESQRLSVWATDEL